jgi:hypothetical protein
MAQVYCPYCGKQAYLVGGSVIYPHRNDLAEKQFYQCKPCDAYVGCHDGTVKPLGRLANTELRRAKMQAHSAFDPKWRNGEMKRASAYKWLAEQLKIDAKDCHIGMMDVDMCKRVVNVCQPAP